MGGGREANKKKKMKNKKRRKGPGIDTSIFFFSLFCLKLYYDVVFRLKPYKIVKRTATVFCCSIDTREAE